MKDRHKRTLRTFFWALTIIAVLTIIAFLNHRQKTAKTIKYTNEPNLSKSSKNRSHVSNDAQVRLKAVVSFQRLIEVSDFKNKNNINHAIEKLEEFIMNYPELIVKLDDASIDKICQNDRLLNVLYDSLSDLLNQSGGASIFVETNPRLAYVLLQKAQSALSAFKMEHLVSLAELNAAYPNYTTSFHPLFEYLSSTVGRLNKEDKNKILAELLANDDRYVSYLAQSQLLLDDFSAGASIFDILDWSSIKQKELDVLVKGYCLGAVNADPDTVAESLISVKNHPARERIYSNYVAELMLKDIENINKILSNDKIPNEIKMLIKKNAIYISLLNN
jgi:hypothetical protein